MSHDTNSEPSDLAQEIRDQMGKAIESGDVAEAKKLLEDNPSLVNTDLRAAKDRDGFTNGLPLFRACQHNDESMAKLFLENGAHPDAPSTEDNPAEFSIPMHYAIHARNYSLAHCLMDHGASPNGYPNCDKANIEIAFYHACSDDMTEQLVRRAYARYLPDGEAGKVDSATTMAGGDVAESIQLFSRMVDAGGQPPFCALVREGYDKLIMEIVAHSPDQEGTPHDHPNSNVFNNVNGAARWYGYPKLVRRLMESYPERYDYHSAIDTIGVAVGSHNRDGGYAEYREIIVMQLEFLKSRGELEKARDDPGFQPLYQLGTDFCWHENYGYRAEIVKPECYVDLAELFVEHGFDGINYVDPKSGHSPLSASVKRGHHPGIVTYIRWLLDQGANMRADESDEKLNPRAIAKALGHDEILSLLRS